MVFERFTTSAIKVIEYAYDFARLTRHNFVGPEQMLIGIVREGQSAAALALIDQGANYERLCWQVESIIGKGVRLVGDDIPFTPRAKLILAALDKNSRTRNNGAIDPNHIFLSIVEQDANVAKRVLTNLKVDVSQVQRKVSQACKDGQA